MKPKTTLRHFLCIASSAVLSFSHAHAAGGSWNVDSSANWATAGNWSPTAVPGTAAGDIINFTNDITTTARTVTIGAGNQTLGTMNIGDANNTHRFIIASTGGLLIFDNSGAGAAINEVGFVAGGSGTPNSSQDAITANIRLDDNLAVSVGGMLSLNGAISQTGTRSITKTGAGTLVLNGLNTYSGGFNLNQGEVMVNTGSISGGISQAFGSGKLTIAGGTTINALADFQLNNAVDMSGTVNLGRGVTGVKTWTQGSTGAVTLTGNTTLNSLLNGFTWVANSVIGESVTSSLTLAGNTMTATLNNANTYTGGTTLSVGTLNINNGGSSSSNSAIGTGTFTISGGTIDNTSGAASSTVTLATNNALALNGTVTYTGTGSRNLNLGTGAVTMASTRTIAVNGGILTIGGNIASTTAGISKTGAGTLVLSGTNSHSGATTNNAGGGVLIFNGGAAMGSGALQVTNATGTYRIQQDAAFSRANSLQVFTNGTMNLVVDRQTPDSGTGMNYQFTAAAGSSGNDISGGSTLTISAGSNITSGVPTVTFTNGIGSASNASASAAVTFNPTGVNLVIASLGTQTNGTRNWTLGGTTTGNSITGTISPNAAAATAFVKSNTSTWTVSGNSTFAQPVSITNGVLKLGAAGSGANSPLGTVAGNTAVTSTGTLDLNGITLVTAEPLSLSGSGTSNSGALANTGAAATFSGPVTLGAAARIVATGNILLTSATAITSGFGLTLDGAATGSSISTAINTGANSVTKEGLGTWTLSNSSNSYSGSTTVTQGRLSISSTGNINSTSGVSIGAGEFNYNNSTTALTHAGTFSGTGGTLSGTGTITPATVITIGNRQTAGTSVTLTNPAPVLGTQTFTTSIDFQEGSIFEWNLTANTEIAEGARGSKYDAVNTASLLNTGAEAIFRVVLNGTENFDEAFWNADRSWADIFKDGGTALNIETIFGANVQYYNSAGLVANGNTTGRSFSISGTTLNWSAVPEPTSALAGLLLSAGLLRRRRK